MSQIDFSSIKKYSKDDKESLNKILKDKLFSLDKKIIVLDDDPTGVQTVHGVDVYTDWTIESIKNGFDDEKSMFFILTNSRSFSTDETIRVHKEICERIMEVSKQVDKDFIIIIRGDSTLRGHYPLDTLSIANTMHSVQGKMPDAEILVPFFLEGGRYTIDDIQYVKEEDVLIEAADTEFSKDKTFGYKNSNLCKWIEEKTNGEYEAKNVISISLDDILNKNIDGISKQLESASNFDKIIVNATSYRDLMVFSIALVDSIMKGKKFIFRTAASFTKVIGGITDKPILKKEDLVCSKNINGGIVVVGSHVKKTTMQLEKLRSIKNIEFIEFNQHLVLEGDDAIEKEVSRVVIEVNKNISASKTVVVYTRRERIDLNTDDKESELKMANKISSSLTSVISLLEVTPKFIIAKGGITSSDIGVTALKVKKASVIGQAAQGVPVWIIGNESKFPNMPYIIFPGNVGSDTTLKEIVETIM